MAIWTTNQY